ncbi:hypothetical protein [Brevundimonas sp.]|uniref:hypothetical protein n=1 Tax=Brevundimonas sp. TaxID=1871086 RepID=UPI002D6BEF29|nr:hypothetical protein [Brevundimonas sp.]HYC97038.1 hypothetical protein [Brevundimonas sp.]
MSSERHFAKYISAYPHKGLRLGDNSESNDRLGELKLTEKGQVLEIFKDRISIAGIFSLGYDSIVEVKTHIGGALRNCNFIEIVDRAGRSYKLSPSGADQVSYLLASFLKAASLPFRRARDRD